MSMRHSRPGPEQLARWAGFPATSLGISGVIMHGRCWHRSTECSLYRATTNRLVTVGPVEQIRRARRKTTVGGSAQNALSCPEAVFLGLGDGTIAVLTVSTWRTPTIDQSSRDVGPSRWSTARTSGGGGCTCGYVIWPAISLLVGSRRLPLLISVCRNRGGTDDTGSDVVDGGYGLVLVSVGRSSKIVKLSGPIVCDQDLRSLLQP